ncbi:MAG: hypothetical protein D5R97_05645 [Candidatus Syntrophonatronum acetioxidans]|uniref:Bacterial transcriptional activator domain-containing protein n=1 Tax=Candidatus Syntrophonatronum acetioxidans TaxID=1795816 RepID=A0A424YE55_9FIRM|nr:MAG: hypothetical protein D5R97_05645 [Candidatus Syntrophonatronum acetioxidans]
MNKNTLEIYSLGYFLIKRGGQVLSENHKKSYRLWALFKYLITFRGKWISGETLAEVLSAREENLYSQQALRTGIYRLRNYLKEGTKESFTFIKSFQGGYSWNTDSEYWLDVEEFESLCKRSREIAREYPKEAIGYLKKAFNLYQGDYLAELTSSDWVIPLRSYYRRLYLECILLLVELLKREGRYDQIIKICEAALLIEPFEEEIHLIYLDALLQEGRKREALIHYEYTITILDRELGVKPSEDLRNIYKKIKREDPGVIEMDLNAIQDTLVELQDINGAFICDPDTFRYIYKLEVRRLSRTGQVAFLGLLSLTSPDYSPLDKKSLKEGMNHLEGILAKSLRRGDVITRWNDAQYLILLPGSNLEQSQGVIHRIKTRFEKGTHAKGIEMKTKLKSLQHLEEKIEI